MKQKWANGLAFVVAFAGVLMAAAVSSARGGFAGRTHAFGRPVVQRAAPGRYDRVRSAQGGRERHYLLSVPKNYNGVGSMPAVVDFHGSGSNPKEELLVTGMARAAENRGFLPVMPVATVDFPLGGYTWNVDDVGFVPDILGDVGKNLCLDERRVVASGFSGGARLASQLGCGLRRSHRGGRRGRRFAPSAQC